LEGAAKTKKPYHVRVCSVGAFPKPYSPRVIWVGIDKGQEETKTIAAELEEKIAGIGIPKEEREFSSHITIGRTRSALNRTRLVQTLVNLMNDSGKLECAEFPVTKITLYKSTLSSAGPLYEVLKEANLKAI
jgi:2'-5' RNA ligase